MTKQITDVRQELDRLVDGLAQTGASPSVAAAIKRRETQQGDLERELAALEQRTQLSDTEVGRLADLARRKVLDWRKVMRRHIPQARQVLQKMLRGRLTFTPEHQGKQRGYRFTGEGSIMPLLTGMVPEFSQAVASPTGFATHGRHPRQGGGGVNGWRPQPDTTDSRAEDDCLYTRIEGWIAA